MKVRTQQRWQRRLPFRLKGPEEGNDEILCPVCGFNCTHVRGLKQVPGNDHYEAHPHVRGDVIEISLWCEMGHGFTVFIGEHKGLNIVWCEAEKNAGHALPSDTEA